MINYVSMSKNGKRNIATLQEKFDEQWMRHQVYIPKVLPTCRVKRVSLRFIMMLTLVCLSVGQVERFKGRSKESHLNLSRKSRSRESIVTDNRTEFSYFDYNRRGWQTFNNWQINEPLLVRYTAIPYNVEIGKRKQQHLLLVTNRSKFSSLPSDFGIWLYTINTNSWQKLDRDEFQPFPEEPLLIRLCSKIIVLGALDNNAFSNSSKVWIFDTISFQWKQTQVIGDLTIWSRFTTNARASQSPDVKAVTVHTTTSCQCKESALVLTYFLSQKVHMYEVRCVNREGIESYEWINWNSNIASISTTQFKLTSAYSNGIVLYVPITKSLWKFDNETWTNVRTIPKHQHPYQDVSRSARFGCVLTNNSSNYIVFNIRDKQLVKFDLKQNTYVIENVVGELPDRWYERVVSTLVETEYIIIVFIIDIRVVRLTVWKFIYDNRVWIWKRLSHPALVPTSREESTYALKGNVLTVVGGYDVYSRRSDASRQQSLSGIIWSLDLTTMQWWLKVKGNASHFIDYEGGCWISSCCLLALRSSIDNRKMETWIYNTSDNSWKLLLSISLILRYHLDLSFEAANETVVILFGRVTRDSESPSAFGKTWILHLESKELQWKPSLADVDHSTRPSARTGHAAVVMESKMYVFGGMSDSLNCLNDLWVFNVTTEQWSVVRAVNKRPDLSGIWPCAYSAASTPGQILVTVTCDKSSDIDTCKDVVIKTWMFIVHLRMWQFIEFSPENEPTRWKEEIISKSVYWKGFLVMFDSHTTNVKYLVVRCPAGFTSSNISDRPCNFCRRGYYRETTFSSPNCIPCPKGLTTNDTGAQSIRECDACDVNICKYGRCVADLSERSIQPACRCYFGFTGSTCQYPTYYLVGVGLILLGALVSACGTGYFLILKRKKINERALRRQVDVLTDVWQIDEDEVTSEERIGSGASGAVYRACYRNIVVAVKKMIAVGLPKSTEDFETEIVFMRTVRHKNIVLFIGAGKSQLEDVPFLVMEYMEHGSLRNVLYDLSIEIDYERKLSFAMDSARGMHFLHTLEPPRIHRDLKSDNLLVSKDWIVKVADFGLGRAITNDLRINDKQQKDPANISRADDTPLLPLRKNLSFSGVGTARWRAPELILREPYDTAVDVYSFGIVLWELCTRQLPFDQYRFNYEVSDAVAEGERPTITRDCPQSLVTLMKNCWSSSPSARLTFGQVISYLQSLQNV